MKKSLLITLISLFSGTLFFSCNNDDYELNFMSYIQGEWACVGINGSYFATDSIIFYDFSSNGKASLSYGTSSTDGSAVWNSYSDLKYTVSNQLLTISSATTTSSTESQVIQELYLHYVNNWVMVCDIISYSVDGVSQVSRQQLQFERVTSVDYSKYIVGIWQTPSQNIASSVIYREFEEDGTFDYFLYNEQTSQYTEQATGVSSYVMYGNYIVLTYTDLNTSNMTYKCWKITSPASTYIINWSNFAVNGNVVYQQLTSTSTLPTVN